MMSTFYLSNIAPQVGKGFNRDAWNKLEMYSRRLTREYDHVYVCSGEWAQEPATTHFFSARHVAGSSSQHECP